MSFREQGFEVLRELIAPAERRPILSQLTQQALSRSLLDEPWCRSLVHTLRCHEALARLLPQSAVAVQCSYFAKSVDSNWLVAWHQDLSIPVRERVDSESCSGWSMKEGGVFVQPPLSVLEQLVAVRLHLDEHTTDNGPLRVVPGSHALGRLSVADIAQQRAIRGETVCVAPECSALVFSPLLLHASSKSHVDVPRRVLHFLFGPQQLSHGLAWRVAVW